jgi:hypothetical protein
MRERDHVENPGVDGRIILRSICRKWTLVNAVMNLRVP